jgi:hypothetical protein
MSDQFLVFEAMSYEMLAAFHQVRRQERDKINCPDEQLIMDALFQMADPLFARIRVFPNWQIGDG